MKDDEQNRFKSCMSEASNAFFSAVESECDEIRCRQETQKALTALKKAANIVNSLLCVKVQ